MKSEKLSMYWGLFTDFWKFFKKYSSVEDTENYWKAVDEESQRLAEKYGRMKFVNRVLAEIILELERCGKAEGQ